MRISTLGARRISRRLVLEPRFSLGICRLFGSCPVRRTALLSTFYALGGSVFRIAGPLLGRSATPIQLGAWRLPRPISRGGTQRNVVFPVASRQRRGNIMGLDCVYLPRWRCRDSLHRGKKTEARSIDLSKTDWNSLVSLPRQKYAWQSDESQQRLNSHKKRSEVCLFERGSQSHQVLPLHAARRKYESRQSVPSFRIVSPSGECQPSTIKPHHVAGIPNCTCRCSACFCCDCPARWFSVVDAAR